MELQEINESNTNESNTNESNINSLSEIDKGDEFDSLLISNINKFYKLKNEYESGILQKKQSLINNNNLSRKERRQLYNKFAPKCIACGCEGGTKFESHKTINGRILEAYCKCSNKCNLKINLNLGSYNIIRKSISSINDELNQLKKQIIVHKNDTLFGVIEEGSFTFETLVNNLEQLNSEYIDYFEYNTMFNDNTVSEENIRLSETELIRMINTFDDAMMSNDVLKILHNIQSNDLFIENSITFTNYFVCVYFVRNINNEINKMKNMDNYYELSSETNPLNYKKKKALLNIKELFNRIIKYKFGKIEFKKDVKENSITFMNNFANNTEINEAEDTKINDFVIDVKKVNVNLNLQRENESNNIEEDGDEVENENTIRINIDNEEEDEEEEDEDEEEDEEEDDEDYKKNPIEIGKENEMEEMEELK
uniref:Uncharacterized protein n=1 Tax=viral metagenome TaxID=1070528 RepID=A0A6C0IMA9_9ZZZZ